MSLPFSNPQAKVDELMQELSSPELSELAKVPLLLSLLILLKLNNVALPDDRFEVYEKLLRHLITEHPRRRREVAGIGVAMSLGPEGAGRVLAHLAYVLQCDHSDGTILRSEATERAEVFLRGDDGLGYAAPEARRHALEVVETDGASTGLLVRRSESEIGFFHRSLQEYLAAQHLSGLTLEAQIQVVRERCKDANWHEVLLGLLRLTSRRNDAENYVKEMQASPLSTLERLDLEVLLTEAAIGDYNLPPSLSRQLLDKAVETVESGGWMPHRGRILARILRGIRQSPIGDRVRRMITQWYPCRQRREYLYDAVAKWRDGEGVFDALWRGLYDDEVENQLAAAAALVERAAGDPGVGQRMAQIARFDQNHMARAAALAALGEGWPTSDDLPRAAGVASRSASPALRWAAVVARVGAVEHTNNDLESLLYLGDWDSRLDHRLRGQIPKLLSRGWRNCNSLKKKCLRLAGSAGGPGGFDRSLALETLLRSFPGDPEVAAWFAAHIERERFPLIGLSMGRAEPWDLLAHNFRDNILIVRAIDTWMEQPDLLDAEPAIAALVGRSPRAKARLLESLSSGTGFPHWPAYGLLEGWGIGDQEVRDLLLPRARDIGSGAMIAHLLPRIVEDRVECRELLLSMLRSQNCARPDFVITGLQKLEATKENPEAASLALAHYSRAPGLNAFEIAGPLIVAFADDARVREVAMDQLKHPEGNDAAVAVAFAHDPEIRSLVLGRLSPLPTQLRDLIVTALAGRPLGDGFSTSHLGEYRREDDPDLRTKACIAFHRRLAKYGADTAQAIATLRKDVVSYSIHYGGGSQRQAALCGLIALERLDIFVDAKEDNPTHENSKIQLRDFQSTNYSFLHYIGQHWAKLRQVLGSSIEARFVDDTRLKEGPWDALSVVAAEYAPLTQELLTRIETVSALPSTPSLLKFLAAVRPKSLLLREKCLELLRNRKVDGFFDDATPVAAELLASNYRDEQTFLDLLDLATVDNSGTRSTYASLLALADAWPESEEVVLRSRRLAGKYVPWDLCFALRFPDGENPQGFVEMLTQYSRNRGGLDVGLSNRVFKFCVRRMAMHDQFFQALLSQFLRGADDNLRVSAPAILASSRGVGPLGRSYLVARLERELSRRLEPIVGFDLRTGQYRSAASALLDVLSAGETRGA